MAWFYSFQIGFVWVVRLHQEESILAGVQSGNIILNTRMSCDARAVDAVDDLRGLKLFRFDNGGLSREATVERDLRRELGGSKENEQRYS